MRMHRHELYNGWLIELVPEPKGFSFQCWQSTDQYVSDSLQNDKAQRVTYPTPEQAVWAAQRLIELETVGLALTRLLQEMGGWARPNHAERAALTQSIREFIKAESDRLSNLSRLKWNDFR